MFSLKHFLKFLNLLSQKKIVRKRTTLYIWG